MKYIVVTNKNYREPLESSIKELEETVNGYLGMGYKPLGGIAISSGRMGQKLMQTLMIDEEPKPITPRKTQKKTKKEVEEQPAQRTANEIVEDAKRRAKKYDKK